MESIQESSYHEPVPQLEPEHSKDSDLFKLTQELNAFSENIRDLKMAIVPASSEVAFSRPFSKKLTVKSLEPPEKLTDPRIAPVMPAEYFFTEKSRPKFQRLEPRAKPLSAVTRVNPKTVLSPHLLKMNLDSIKIRQLS